MRWPEHTWGPLSAQQDKQQGAPPCLRVTSLSRRARVLTVCRETEDACFRAFSGKFGLEPRGSERCTPPCLTHPNHHTQERRDGVAMCRGSRSIACLARTLPVLCARRTLPWVRVALTAHHHTRGTTVPSQQRDELALGLGIPLDVALGHGQAGMAGELLDIPEAPSDLRHFACGARNEGPASGVR